MRTTVTLDSDTEASLRRLMAERGVSFKRALNDAIRAGTQQGEQQQRTYTRSREMGAPRASLDKALQIAADLEDEELVRKMRLGK